MIKQIFNQDKDLTRGPVLHKIISLATPLMVIAVLQTTQSLIDMFWVGRLGPSSIAAVAMSGMLIMVLFTMAVGVSTGTVALVARYVGAKDKERANAVATQSIFLGVIMAVLVIAVGLVFAKRLLLILGAGPDVLEAGIGYLKILLVGGVTMFLLFTGNSILRGAGDTVVPMIITLLTLWGFQIPMALFLSKTTTLGVTGIWWAIALASVLNGLLILGWFELGKWKKKAEPVIL